MLRVGQLAAKEITRAVGHGGCGWEGAAAAARRRRGGGRPEAELPEAELPEAELGLGVREFPGTDGAMVDRFLEENSEWLVGMGVVSAIMFVGSLVLMPMLVVRMRADYFLRGRGGAERAAGSHPVWRWVVLGLKNLLGLVLLVLGVAMLVGPGQGVLTILVSLSLLTFPGKRQLEIQLLRRLPGVLVAINRLRQRAGREPVRLPD